MPLSYRETSAPAVEPITLVQAKQQLVLDDSFTADDALISGYIVAARQYCEKVMQRSIYNRTMLLTLDYFPLASDCPMGANQYAYVSSYIRSLSIIVPKPGLVSVQSISYMDTVNNTVTMSPSAYWPDRCFVPDGLLV